MTRLPRLARRGVRAAGDSGRPGTGSGWSSGAQIGKIAGIGTALAAIALAAAGCEGGAIGANTPVSNGQNFVSGSYETTVFRTGARPVAPAVSGTTLTGKKLSLAAYRGDVVVLNFWGSWCAPCRAEAPALGTLARQLSGRGVRFVGVDIRDEPDAALAFMQNFNIGYPSLNDPNDDIALLFRTTVPPAAIPSTVIIDGRGRIAARIVGSVSYPSLKAMIMKVVAGHS